MRRLGFNEISARTHSGISSGKPPTDRDPRFYSSGAGENGGGTDDLAPG